MPENKALIQPFDWPIENDRAVPESCYQMVARTFLAFCTLEQTDGNTGYRL
jgi:hypothetical protein